MKIFFWTLLLNVLVASGTTSADTKILKWVDKQGVTHYGDLPPSFEESKSNVEMNKRGQVVKKMTTRLEKSIIKIYNKAIKIAKIKFY